MKKILLVLSALLILAGGVGVLVTGRGGPESSSATSGTAAHGTSISGIPAPGIPMPGPAAAQNSAARAPDFASATDQALKASAPFPSSGSAASAEQAAGVTGGAATGVAGGAAGGVGGGDLTSVSGSFSPTAGSVGPKVIKTADLTVEVKAGTFSTAFSDAGFVAQKYGGYVVASSTSGDKAKSGNLMIRVPSKNFGYAMKDLEGLGVTKSESMNGQEVTSQFVDLNARLKTWQSQEAVLLRLMDNANTISDTMTVQRELQQVQYQIEQIKGQLRVLRDQTSFASIAVTIREPGVVTTPPKSHQPSLSEAWDKAMAGVMGIAFVVVVGLGYVVPLGLMALIGWAVVRRARRPRPTVA